MNNTVALNGLARCLVNEHLLTHDEALAHLKASETENQAFIHYLVTKNIIDAQRIAVAAANEFGSPLYDLESHDIDASPKNLIDKKLVRKHQALPLFKRGNHLFIAMLDPTNLRALDDIKFNTGHRVEAVLVEADKLIVMIDNYLNDDANNQGSLGDLSDEGLEDLDVSNTTEDDDDDVTNDDDEAPIVKFVNKILLDAIRKNASDIHFEPYEKAYRIRFRIDGILQEIHKPPVNSISPIGSFKSHV